VTITALQATLQPFIGVLLPITLLRRLFACLARDLNLRPLAPSAQFSALLQPFALTCSAARKWAVTCTDGDQPTLLPYVTACSTLRTYAPQSAAKVRPPSNLVVTAPLVSKETPSTLGLAVTPSPWGPLRVDTALATTCGKVERFQQTMKAPHPTRPSHQHPRPPGPPRRLRHRVQRPPAPPIPGTPGNPGHRLHDPAQSVPEHRGPRRRHPRPSPLRQGRQSRQDPAIPRPDVLHRNRPKPHRNPRHRPGPRPRHPHHQRRHPAHSSASSSSTHPSATKAPDAHPAPPGETKEGRTHIYWVRPSAMS
jgi:hypothetical protein